MNDFENELCQATKFEELFDCLVRVSKTKTLAVYKISYVGKKCRPEVYLSSETFETYGMQIPESNLQAFVENHHELLEFQSPDQNAWIIAKLPNLNLKLNRDILVICMPKNEIEAKYLTRFSHEWGWHMRLGQAEELLLVDELTGLYNMRYLDRAMDHELLRSQRFNTPFSILFIDLDNFKSVNDTHGHLTGSGLLKAVGQAIRDAVREVDSVVRYGGDEFVAILLGANSTMAMNVAERVRSFVSRAFVEVDSEKISTTGSIGIASYPSHGTTRNSLLAAADSSMYHIKNSGKNAVGRPKHNPFQKGVPPEQKQHL
jgi:diguanylate cyclase (GGDEF)-like protein